MIEHIIENYDNYIYLRKTFINIKDIEHLYRKIIFNKITPYDLYQFIENLHTIMTINEKVKKDKTMQEYIKNNIGENIESTCKKLISVLERNLNKEICKTLVNNKFEINFFNTQVNNLLDKTHKEFQEVEEELNSVIDIFTKMIHERDSKAKDPIKFIKLKKVECIYMLQISVVKFLKQV